VRRKIEIVRSRSTAFPFRPSRSAHTNLAEAAGTGIGVTGGRIGQQLALQVVQLVLQIELYHALREHVRFNEVQIQSSGPGSCQ